MMISKPRDYNETSAFGSGFKALPKGGYICRILMAEEMEDKNRNPMIHFAFDIIDGEYTGYFMNLYEQRKKSSDDPKSVKYPFEGQMWIPVYDYEKPQQTNRKFKGLCTALEDSGTEVWSPRSEFLTSHLKNAEVGVIFKREEREYEGKKSWRTVPWACRSVETILSEDYFVPEDKPLKEEAPYADNSYGGFEPVYSSDPNPFG